MMDFLIGRRPITDAQANTSDMDKQARDQNLRDHGTAADG